MHAGIVQRHLRVDTPDLPPLEAKPQAEVGLLPRDQIVAIAIDRAQGLDPEQHVATAGLHKADRHVPLVIAQRIVEARLREALAAAAEHGAKRRLGVQRRLSLRQPVRIELAIANHELDVAEPRMLREQAPPAGVASARCGKAMLGRQALDAHAETKRKVDAAVGRS